MPVSSTIDTSKLLAELTGVDWGVAPTDAGTLVRERHEIRRTPIRDLPHAAIARVLDMGSDADILVPVALERLRDDPDAVDLLCAVLRVEHFAWRSQPELVAAVRDRVYTVTSEIGQITSDLERLQNEAAVWRFYAEFERGLSVVTMRCSERRRAMRLQSARPVAAVVELGSLIWLEFVKRTVRLPSRKFFVFPVSRHRGWAESEAGTLSFLRLFNAEMRESTRRFSPREVINRSRSDAALFLV